MQITKKILVHTALTVCIASPSSAFAQRSFPDVPSDHPSYAAIEALAGEGIVEGNPDGTFRPDATINRAEFVKIVASAVETERGVEDSKASMCERAADFGFWSDRFFDVRVTDWYAQFVCVAFWHGLLNGYPDGTFRPSASISFVEAAKVVANATGFTEQNNLTEVQRQGGHFSDSWFVPYVQYLSLRGAIPPSIQRFEQLITRGEMAEMYWRLRSRTTDLPAQTYEGIAGVAENSFGVIELANAGQAQGDYGDKAIVLQRPHMAQEVLVESVGALVSPETTFSEYRVPDSYKLLARLSPSVVIIERYVPEIYFRGMLYKYDADTRKMTKMRINEQFLYGEGTPSPDGTLLAWMKDQPSFDNAPTELYVLDLVRDTATLVASLPSDESLGEISGGPGGPFTDISWVSPTTIRYPVYSCERGDYDVTCIDLKEYRTVSIGE